MRQSGLTGVARWISRLGMAAPAIFLLELHRPFSPIAGQAALFFQPVLGVFFDDESITRLSHGLSDAHSLDELIRQLESGL